MMRMLRGVATKYLNRYAALFSLIAMTAERSVTEAARGTAPCAPSGSR